LTIQRQELNAATLLPKVEQSKCFIAAARNIAKKKINDIEI